MAKVHVTNVKFVGNPCSFYSPFQFEVTFVCIAELHGELKWKMIYVGSSESEYFDQVLEPLLWDQCWLAGTFSCLNPIRQMRRKYPTEMPSVQLWS